MLARVVGDAEQRADQVAGDLAGYWEAECLGFLVPQREGSLEEGVAGFPPDVGRVARPCPLCAGTMVASRNLRVNEASCELMRRAAR